MMFKWSARPSAPLPALFSAAQQRESIITRRAEDVVAAVVASSSSSPSLSLSSSLPLLPASSSLPTPPPLSLRYRPGARSRRTPFGRRRPRRGLDGPRRQLEATAAPAAPAATPATARLRVCASARLRVCASATAATARLRLRRCRLACCVHASVLSEHLKSFMCSSTAHLLHRPNTTSSPRSTLHRPTAACWRGRLSGRLTLAVAARHAGTAGRAAAGRSARLAGAAGTGTACCCRCGARRLRLQRARRGGERLVPDGAPAGR